MRKFWSYISNGKYSAGCTQQGVYVYDSEGKELVKLKSIKNELHPALSPNSDILVVKSTGAYFAVYSLETLSLIKTVRFSNVDGSQDDGYCFSKDGKFFYNVERQRSSVHSVISVYDTKDFERIQMFLDKDDKTEPKLIEPDENGDLFVMGFLRGDNGVMNSGFVSRFGDNGLEDIQLILREDFEFYHNFKNLELKGFTDQAKKWSGFNANVDMTGMENMKYPLSEIWEKYNKKNNNKKGTKP